MSTSLLPGETVQFRLSREGSIGLAGFFDVMSFEAFVTDVDELGAWVDFGDESAFLLKWAYIATMVVPLHPPGNPGPDLKKIGF